MTPIEKEAKIWQLVVLIPLAVVILWVFLGVFSVLLGFRSSFAYATTFFTDDFESYNLGDLQGQGSWTGDTTFDIVNTIKHSGDKGVEINSIVPNQSIYKTASSLEIGEFKIWFYIFSGKVRFRFYCESDHPVWDMIWLEGFVSSGSVDVSRYLSGSGFVEVFPDLTLEQWHSLEINWYKLGDRLKYRLKIDTGNFTEYFDIGYDNTNIVGVNKFTLEIGDEGKFYIDDIGEVAPPELVPRVWGIDPVSESDITDLEDTFEFGWEDLDEWDSFSIVFQNRATGIFTEAKEILTTTTPSGEGVFNFTDFNFDRNGKYYFYATATRYVPEVIEGMYLTGRYSYEWSDDLVDPEYWLTINIEGFTPIFEMSDFEEWYSINAKFDEPTEMFSTIAGFFSPIFSKIGEFGNRIKDYFNVNESYSQGYEIGKAVPYFTYFVSEISLFLGGFPILKWFFILALLLTGIFIFRLILKFIPFLG